MANKENKKKETSIDNLESLKDVQKKETEKRLEKEAKDKTAAVKTGVVNCDKLRVRKGPSTDAEILKYLKKGDEVVIESEDDENFYKIAAGFVMKEYISLKI